MTGKVDQGKVVVMMRLKLLVLILIDNVFGVRMFRKSLDYAEVGDNIGILVRV